MMKVKTLSLNFDGVMWKPVIRYGKFYVQFKNKAQNVVFVKA